MNIKKILLVLICLLVLSGCKIENISDKDVNKNLNLIMNKKIKNTNKSAIGYKYFLPSYMSVINSNDFNEEIYYNGNIFYLYTDIVSYYHKVNKTYEIDSKAYISKKLNYNKKTGYLEVNKYNNKYFIEMMFNYAKIEGYCNKYELIDTISSLAYVLTSINYNDNTIETLLGDKRFDLSDNETYNIFNAKKKQDSNFLNYVDEYDKYNGSDASTLIEKQEVETDKKED